MGTVNKRNIDKNSPQYIVSQYKTARANLLLAIIFTLVNIVLFFAQTGNYFLFSATIPYALVINSLVLGGVAVVAALLILVVYLLCYLFSKKSYGWMIAALVLFSLDTLALLYFAFSGDSFADYILDIVFHAYVLFFLILGVRYGRKYPAAEQEILAAAAQQVPYSAESSETEHFQPDSSAENTEQNCRDDSDIVEKAKNEESHY